MLLNLKRGVGKLKNINASTKSFFLITIFNGIFFSGWGLYFNFYILERGFDKTFLGFASAIFPIAILLFSLPMGLVFNKIGGKKSMMWGQVIFLIGTFLVVMAKTKVLISLSFFLAGIGDSLYIVSATPLLSRLAGKNNRESVFAINAGLLTFSVMVGNYIGGVMPTWLSRFGDIPQKSLLSYQVIMLIGIILSILIFIPLYKIQETVIVKADNQESAKGKPKNLVKNILLNKKLLQFFLPYFLGGLAIAFVIPYLNLFFVEKFQISELQLGIVFSVSAFVSAVFIFLGPSLSKKMGSPVNAFLLLQWIGILFLGIVGFSQIWGIVVAGFLINHTVMNMGTPIIDSFAMSQVDESEQGTLSSMLVLGMKGGFAVGAMSSGMLQDLYGYPLVFVLSIVFFALSALSIWKFFGNTKLPISISVIPEKINPEFEGIVNEN